MKKIVKLPLTKEKIANLQIGELVYLSGEIYSARDIAHSRLAKLIETCDRLPFDVKNQTIYYCGPIFSKDNPEIPTAFGPTTSKRMDYFTEHLLKAGVLGLIGKGERSAEVSEKIRTYGSVYFAAIGGCGALYAQCVVSSSPVAFPELGCEMIRKFVIDKMPVFVAIK